MAPDYVDMNANLSLLILNVSSNTFFSKSPNL